MDSIYHGLHGLCNGTVSVRPSVRLIYRMSIDVTLSPAFAAAASCCGAVAAGRPPLSIYIRCTGAPSSKPAARHCCGRSIGQTYRRKDTRPLHTLCSAYYADSVNKVSPRGRRDDMPRPMAIRLAADLRPSANGSAVRTSLVVAKLQAASVPIAYGTCAPSAMGQTDGGSRYSKMPPYRAGA